VDPTLPGGIGHRTVSVCAGRSTQRSSIENEDPTLAVRPPRRRRPDTVRKPESHHLVESTPQVLRDTNLSFGVTEGPRSDAQAKSEGTPLITSTPDPGRVPQVEQTSRSALPSSDSGLEASPSTGPSRPRRRFSRVRLCPVVSVAFTPREPISRMLMFFYPSGCFIPRASA